MIDLSQQQHTYIVDTLKQYLPSSCKVYAFGSRTKGTSRVTSDLDLLIISPNKLEPSLMAELGETFADSDLPFEVDVVQQRDISTDFLNHIHPDLAPLLD